MTTPIRPLKAYCSACGEQVPISLERPRPDMTGEQLYADLMCGYCRLVILTFTLPVCRPAIRMTQLRIPITE